MTKRNKSIAIVGVLLALIVIGKVTGGAETKKATDRSIEKVETDNFISGLKPVDIYLNFEERGYNIEKQLSSEGNIWTCTKSEAGIDYNVSVFSMKADAVETVRATATINGSEPKKTVAVQPFLKYISSLPFTDNDPQKTAEWLEQNFNVNGSSLTISDVKFSLYAPTEFVRTLTIEKTK